MKKTFLALLLTFFTITLFGQINKQDLPQYFIQNGDTLGIILTVEQVQKLDNDVELLNMFELLSIKCDSLDKHYVKVINDLNDVIVLKDVSITNLTKQTKTFTNQVEKLKSAVDIKESQLKLCEEQRVNDSTAIASLKKDLKKAKVKNIVSWSSTGVVSGIVIFLTIFLGVR